MYTVTYQNRHTGIHGVAGYEETEKKAMRLAKVFLADNRNALAKERRERRDACANYEILLLEYSEALDSLAKSAGICTANILWWDEDTIKRIEKLRNKISEGKGKA